VRYYIIAGEASGDLHASNLMKGIRDEDPDAVFRFWGGDLMQQQGGELVKHYRDLAYMGFLEVIAHLPVILKNLSFCETDLLQFEPDVLVLVDYPGFNLRMARFASRHGIRVCYYISPQLWAWRSSRVKKIKRYVNKMFVILPFEKEFYLRHQYPVEFVGHPLLDVIHEKMDIPPLPQFLSSNKLDERPIVALLPGSRAMEIRKILKGMIAIRDFFPEYQFVIAAAPSIPATLYQDITRSADVQVVRNQTYSLLRYSRAAMVGSGTATLETALMGVPQVVCYKGNYLSYLIARRLVHVKYISLVNLIADKPLVTELIQKDMNTGRLKESLQKLLAEGSVREGIVSGYADLKRTLGGGGASFRTAKHIVQYLGAILLFFFILTPCFSQQMQQKALLDSGIVKARLFDFNAALVDFNKAVRIDSTEAEPWYNRGIVLSELKDYQKAIDDFTRVIQLRPSYPEPYYNRGLARDFLKDYDGAVQDYSKAIALKADFPEAYHNRGLARLDMGNNREALNDFTRALQYKPGFAEAFYNRGLCRFNLSDYSGAVQDFNDAIRIDTTQYAYYSSRGAAKAASGSFDDAIADFSQALTIHPADDNARKNLALANLYLKRYQEAADQYSQILEKQPGDMEALANRGVARNYLGDKKGACEDWNLAAQLGSEKSKTWLKDFCN